jgi:hypothetical protein
MTEAIHPLAPEHLPGFLPGPDGSDFLFSVVVGLIVVLMLVIGNLYLKLHALPERMAHRQNNTQLQIITALALLALFTHNNVFWVAALLLAVVRWPDFSTPLNSIADSLEKLTSEASETKLQEPVQPSTEADQPQSEAKLQED